MLVQIIAAIALLLGLTAVVLLIVLLRRSASQQLETLIRATTDTALNRVEQNVRLELNARLDALREALDARLDRLEGQSAREFGEHLEKNLQAAAQLRTELAAAAERARNETRQQFGDFQTGSAQALADARSAQNQQLSDFSERLAQLQQHTLEMLAAQRRELSAAAEATRKALESRLDALAEQNEKKLEQMRQTVDEKLQETLEKRIGESFKQVSENLEKVIRFAGEMQAAVADVGDLKRVLANVKTRGTWGETQLAMLLENFLQADQYATNVKPNPRSDRIVEFAVKLPGQDDSGKPVWLPIDSKFPREDYERLALAAERGDAAGVEQAAKALTAGVESFARDIRDKYISPPHTTDFAILFLPTEGLYAEVLRRPGVADRLQRECRVLLAGPTTLAAILNSLQMGFRTLAIQKKSGEVWKILGAVKTQFGMFGDLLQKVQKKLDEAGRAVGEAANRHRILSNRMTKVEELPASEAQAITGLADNSPEGDASPAP